MDELAVLLSLILGVRMHAEQINRRFDDFSGCCCVDGRSSDATRGAIRAQCSAMRLSLREASRTLPAL
jgi:hypothetical protein